MFVLYKGLVCLRHTGGATEGVVLPRTPKGGAFALSLPDVSLATPHTTADGLQAYKPQGGLTSCGSQLRRWTDLSLFLPSHPRENEAGSSRPTGQGLTQLGLAWETSSCWLEGLTLRIETSVLMPRAWDPSPASPWTITNNNQ